MASLYGGLFPSAVSRVTLPLLFLSVVSFASAFTFSCRIQCVTIVFLVLDLCCLKVDIRHGIAQNLLFAIFLHSMMILGLLLITNC